MSEKWSHTDNLAGTIQLMGSAPATGAVLGAVANHFSNRAFEFTVW
jgi:hypothetical protein